MIVQKNADDKTIKIWDLESSTCVATLIEHIDWVLSLQLKQSGELISASFDQTIKIWNLENYVLIKSIEGNLFIKYII